MVRAVGLQGTSDTSSLARQRSPELDSHRKDVAPRHERRQRWEHGSFFPLTRESGRAVLPWSASPHSLWGSGRDALRALVQEHVSTDGWRRLLVPSYYCQDVLASLAQDIELSVYTWGPLSRTTEVRAGSKDAVLSVALYGKRSTVVVRGAAAVIEDHSHGPSSDVATESRADYAVASLRKTLPLPDGGVVWSPTDRPVPAEIRPTSEHAVAVLAQFSAMALKGMYLEDEGGSKSAYLQLRSDGERAMAQGPISGISDYSRARLPTLPTSAWSRIRARNVAVFREALGEDDRVRMLDAPFAAVLLFQSREERDHVRDRLIAVHVYPSILWPLEETVVQGVSEEDRAVSRCVLSLHCDQRYDEADMRRAAEELKRALRSRP